MASVTGPLSSLILTVVFTVMWRSYRERWLGLWAVASALWTLRYLTSSGLTALDAPHRYEIVHAIALARNYYLLLGAYSLVDRPLSRVWYGLLGADALLLLWEAQFGALTLAGGLGAPHYLLYGITTAAAAQLLYAQRVRLGREALMVAGCLIVVGILVAAFPWLRQLPDLQPVLFGMVHAAQLGIGFSALLLSQRRALAERDAALARLEVALSRAIAGMLPLCLYCKAIRNDEGEWERLEAYFHRHASTVFSHGICPECLREHYPQHAHALSSSRTE